MNSDAGERVSRRTFLRAGAGAAVAGAAVTGTVTAQESGGKTVEVGPGGNFSFDPETVYVKPGNTVTWQWASSGHNVVPSETPEGSSWEGHEPLEDSGTTYKHTFETKGTYKYVCTPHASSGMKGEVVVTDSPPKNEGYQSVLPDSAKTLAVAAVGSMTSVLGLTYFFMRYGGDYGEGDAE